jgi:atypical dual specificity phosphatase
MDRFYWLIEHEIAGCSRPGGTNHHHAPAQFGTQPSASEQAQLEHDLNWLRDFGIGAIVTLTEQPLDERVLAEQGLSALHIPIDDLHAPSPEQFMQALDFIDEQRRLGRRVAVHCLMGQGRTGTILAAYLIRAGSPADDAIERLRQMCPGAIGTSEQEQALVSFAQRSDWIA